MKRGGEGGQAKGNRKGERGWGDKERGSEAEEDTRERGKRKGVR